MTALTLVHHHLCCPLLGKSCLFLVLCCPSSGSGTRCANSIRTSWSHLCSCSVVAVHSAVCYVSSAVMAKNSSQQVIRAHTRCEKVVHQLTSITSAAMRFVKRALVQKFSLSKSLLLAKPQDKQHVTVSVCLKAVLWWHIGLLCQ